MFFEFPEIRRVKDVAEYIKDYDCFDFSKKEHYSVITSSEYDEKVFEIKDPSDMGAIIRNECFGIIFDEKGEVISRPFHKLLNIYSGLERGAENKVLLSDVMAGVMVRPLLLAGEMRFATETGTTNISHNVENWVTNNCKDKTSWIEGQLSSSKTPTFEWVSSFNCKTLCYDFADLIYWGSRDNFSGSYSFDEECPFTKVSSDIAIRRSITSAKVLYAEEV